MFSTKINIQQLTSLMLKADIRKVVVSPGSRNAALVHNFKAASMECYEVTDERSAGFIALGLIEANGGKPVAVCCTSGSAVVNLAPAVVEAYYRPLPLFVITADRPEMWIGQMDGQTMKQPEAFKGFINKSVSLPEPRDDEERWYCNRLINEALIVMHKTLGPVHVNVPITEPMFDFTATSLPEERLIRFCRQSKDLSLSEKFNSIVEHTVRPMIVIGQMLPEELQLCAPYLSSLAKKGWCILAENLSNVHISDELRNNVVEHFDDLLSEHNPQTPDLLITIGGHIVSKRLKKYFRVNKPDQHIEINMTGDIADTFQSLTFLIQTSPVDFLMLLETYEYKYVSSDFGKDWKRDIVSEKMPYLETLFENLSDEWTIQVANSSMVRKVQKVFKGKNPIYCNRGINGIEGSVSAAVGYWIGSGKPTILLTGDLSFFYDQNALWNNMVKSEPHSTPLRILIINNCGGQIFNGLPGLSSSPYLEKSIAASHITSAEGIAKECGCKYYKADNFEEYKSSFLDFIDVKCKDVRIFDVNTHNF
ncbi:MAG: 2-succinyl-5-enolpyruvyl-6-hydroxy-3-cyclohexene-1-carboxylic-acid synthase [Bacteroidaceae bacterium]|nr:2-succinyl-5-enolpyruvyl-6-hydroxy-3-cyclohexene-1-carboxylic-acid synthase [Bacteroidaceae bacterium]